MRLRGGGSSSSSRHPNVPSLSTLLISDPPVIVIEDDDDDPHVAEPKQPSHYSGLSPLLSPVDSHYASSISSSCCSSPHLLSVSQPLPPLQGDDPPKRLKRHPSISSLSSITSNGSSSSSSLTTKPTLWHVASPLLSPLLSPSSTAPFTQQQPSTLTSPTSPSAPSACMAQPCRSPSPVSTVTPKQDHSRPPLPPATQIIVNEQGETVLKRRRGRPPNLREPSEEGGWTFLTPTVWNVKHQQPPQEAEETRDQQQPPQEHAGSSSIMTGEFAAFSSSSEEHHTSLQMPRKKRGRKPKTQMAGNSCFVWKDISATRRSTKAMKLAQEQQKQRDYLQDQGSTSSTTTATATRLRRIEQAPPPPPATTANTN